MTRDVTLLNYLPPYMQEFGEIAATLEAEDPEFVLVWNATDQTLNNKFISTADEYGISRYESILGILPYEEDTLESRRARVSARWFATVPYTIKMLLQKLVTVCGDTDFEVSDNFGEGYTLTIITNLEKYGQVDELEKILEEWLPTNIVYDFTNQIICTASGGSAVGGGTAYCDTFKLVSDEIVQYDTQQTANLASGVVFAEIIAI